jgi:hypothetical protein
VSARSRSNAFRKYNFAVFSALLPRRARRFAAGPFSGGERRTVRRQRTDALSANLGRRSRTFRAGCAEGDDAGLPFLLVTFLWASKEK